MINKYLVFIFFIFISIYHCIINIYVFSFSIIFFFKITVSNYLQNYLYNSRVNKIMMPKKLSPASEALIKKISETSQKQGKDIWIPDITQRGNFLFHAGKFNEALEYYSLAVDVNPAEPGSWHNLGNNYKMLNNLPKAFDCFQKVISLDKNNFECLLNIGNCYVTWNQPDLAIEYYLKASLLNQQSTIPLKSLAYIYKQKQNFGQALIYNEKCLLLDPKNIQTLMEVAMISLLLAKTEKGIECLKKVFEIDPTNQMAHILMFKLKEENKL